MESKGVVKVSFLNFTSIVADQYGYLRYGITVSGELVRLIDGGDEKILVKPVNLVTDISNVVPTIPR
jgi:hypothetical protein